MNDLWIDVEHGQHQYYQNQLKNLTYINIVQFSSYYQLKNP